MFGTGSRTPVEWLIAGLGNPGEKYANTRHNMGFRTVELLAEQQRVKLNRIKFRSAYNILDFAGTRCIVLKPQTYMNLSGDAVQEAAGFYKIPPEKTLIIYDDISLPVGRIRVRPHGSSGGHNGIKHIIACLGTQEFPRIKIGVGSPGKEEDINRIDWVTGVPGLAEREILCKAFEQAVQAAACMIKHGCQQAMNDFNSH